MKKAGLLVAAVFLVSGILQAAQRDYTEGLSIWFDVPNDLSGRAVWLGNGKDRWRGESDPDKAASTIANSDMDWECRSLPLGNGHIGANILGSVAAERITFNEKTLWKGGPNTAGGADYYWNVNKQSTHVLGEIRQAFLDGDQQKAALLTAKNFNGLAGYEANSEEPFRFGNYTTMGEFYIETGLSEIGMSDYRRILSLDSALAVVEFKKDGVFYQRKSFISYPDQVMVMQFTADQPGKQHLVFSYCPNPDADGSMVAEGNNRLKYVGHLKNNQMKFVIRIEAIPQGGSVTAKDGKLTITGAGSVVFLVTAATDYRMNFDPDFSDPKIYVGADPEPLTLERLNAAAAKNYGSLYRRHLDDYNALFQRVRFKINPDAVRANWPTAKRLAEYRKGNPDYYLEELYYQYGRYLLIGSSRAGSMPANLQGIWHNNTDGPWRVDYHNNINIQMNYWPACPTNLQECMEPLVDFIRGLVKPGEKTAQSYFGARGWTASISANIFGFTSPLSSEAMSWNFNPMAGPWLATHVWEYYDYTRDKRFLQDVGYELIRSSARFTIDFLWKHPDGYYTAAPSTSPEHGPVDQGATFVHAVAREILLDAIDAATVLGVDKQERKQWAELLAKLKPYQIGRYGQLMEWSEDIDDPDDQHRHVNHLFGLHPGHTISPIATPELAEASKVVLNHRGDLATGWSIGWKLNQWARLHEGNRAYVLYGNLLKTGTLDNLWDSHPPFQIDGNFGGVAGVTEMLLQSHMGFIHLLPALPDAWKDGLIEGIRAKGNFEVSLYWKDNELEKAMILSGSGEPCSIRYRDQIMKFRTQKGKSYEISESGGKLHLKSL